jgi:leucyl/phenylalanyl-tRNA---protein transferase
LDNTDTIIQFPDPNLADDEGIVAVGGELSPRFLLSAYMQGIFPWFSDDQPILWWSPNPRLILYPKDFKISNSLKQLIRSKKFEIRIDVDFARVIDNCSKVYRAGQDGTWITSEMKNAYVELHRLGFAHSFETYWNGKLVGGLYGVSLGNAFFGESMFFLERDASKFALYNLVNWCLDNGFTLIDAQQPTAHLKSLGAIEVERTFFLDLLGKCLERPTLSGKWSIT